MLGDESLEAVVQAVIPYGRIQTVFIRKVVSHSVAGCGTQLGLTSGRARVVPHILRTMTKDTLLPVVKTDIFRADGQDRKGN